MTMFFSPAMVAFYDDALKADYENSGTWPGDAIQISDVKYQALLAGQSNGKVIISSGSGKPVLVAPPPPTKEDMVSTADATKAGYMDAANVAIYPLQDAVELGMATDEEVAQLAAWKQYRVYLNRVDTSMAPDITWPSPPAVSVA